MTSLAIRLRTPPRPVQWLAARAPALFAVAMAAVAVHLLDDALVDGWRRESVGSALATIAVPLAVAAAVAFAYRRLRPGIQAWLAFVFGLLAAIDGGIHLQHVSRAGGASGTDLTGLLSGIVGVALVVAGSSLVFRPKARRAPLRRWALRAAAALGTVATVVFVVVPVSLAVYSVHKGPLHVETTQLGIPHEDVVFRSTDGLRLSGWYVRPRNGAAVVLVHGSGGYRLGVESRAVMLARHGYGVLLYDARGAGDSEGRPENLGWTWHRDLQGAVGFLRGRGVTRIGVLGLSTGGEVALETAGRDPRIRAVVAEGTQARTFTDGTKLPVTRSNLFAAAFTSAAFAAYHVISHVASPPALETMVRRIGRRPVFLISARDPFERDANRVYYRAARGPRLLWETDSAHTGAFAKHPREYERRVAAFFGAYLLGRP